MTVRRLREREGSAVGLAVAVVAGLALLTGCAAGAVPAPRTTPNAVEKAAVLRTSQAFFTETADARLPWIQLWTSAQFPTAMQNCAAHESYGQLEVTIAVPELSRPTYRIVGSGSEPNEAEAARIISRCAAATPLDDRVLQLPASDADALYSYALTTLRPCLLAHGYSVRRMPARADFEERLRGQQPWSPYDTVIVTTRLAWYAISDACPALPAALSSAATLEP
ncbi:MAG: hypothetical protein ABJA11_03185 [Pseudolysinimonas sp.]